jgi:hypothetical protein
LLTPLDHQNKTAIENSKHMDKIKLAE